MVKDYDNIEISVEEIIDPIKLRYHKLKTQIRPTELSVILRILEFYKQNYPIFKTDFIKDNLDETYNVHSAVFVYNAFSKFRKPRDIELTQSHKDRMNYLQEDYSTSNEIFRNHSKKKSAKYGGFAILLGYNGQLYYAKRYIIDTLIYPPLFKTEIKKTTLSNVLIRHEITLDQIIGQLKVNIRNKTPHIKLKEYIELLDIILEGITFNLETESLITLSEDIINDLYREVIVE